MRYLLSLLLTSSILFGATASSVTDGPITWTFDTTYTVGQFVCGEWWVKDEGSGVTINSITRPYAQSNRDGTTIDPGQASGLQQGWDDRAQGGGTHFSYNSNTNIANSLPYTVNVVSDPISVCSALSRESSNNRCVILEHRVLTVLTNEPASTDFRPAYAPGAKTIYSATGLQTNLIPNLTAIGGEYTYTQMTNCVGPSVYMDFQQWSWSVEQYRAKNALNVDGGESSSYYAAPRGSYHGAYLSMLAHDAGLSGAQKDFLAKRMVQRGIDFYGNVLAGGYNGYIGGTMGVGALTPIMFAGLMLNDTNMLYITANAPLGKIQTFQECSQPFYLTQTYKDNNPTPYGSLAVTGYGAPLSSSWIWWDERGGTNGCPAWREAQAYQLSGELAGKMNYEQISWAADIGTAAFAMIYGLREELDSEEMFDFVGRGYDLSYSSGHGNSYNNTAWAEYWDYGTPQFGEDTTAPTLTSGEITVDGDYIHLNCNEYVTIGSGGNGGVTMSMSGGAVTATYSSGDGTGTLVYSLSRTIAYDETGTVSYTQPGDGIEDIAGNDLATFSGTSVVNNVPNPSQVATPTSNYTGGSYIQELGIELSCATSSSTIFYTLDGSSPTTNSTEYTTSFTLTAPTRVRAFAVRDSWDDSAELDVTYTIGTFTSEGSGQFDSAQFPQSYTNEFTIRFFTSANSDVIDGVVGVGNTAATDYSDLACIVRLNSSSVIDVRNGAAYSGSYSYTSNTTYRVEMLIDPQAHTYDAFITESGVRTQVADDYDFRTDQASLSEFSYVGWRNTYETQTIWDIEFVQGDAVVDAAPRGRRLSGGVTVGGDVNAGL